MKVTSFIGVSDEAYESFKKSVVMPYTKTFIELALDFIRKFSGFEVTVVMY
jgi:hypothetical protein